MKKLFSIMIIVLSIFFINSNVYAANVKITNVELDSKSDTVTINKDATFNGLEVDTDVHFMMKDDFVKYKITLTNNDNESYKIASNTNNNSDYVEYIYENVDEINANSTETIYMTIKYKKLVEDDKYDNDNKYSENNVETITLSNEAGELVKVDNPSTFSNTSDIILFVGIVLLSCGIGVILIKGKRAHILSIILLGVISIPIVCNATGLIELKVNSKVDFDYANSEFCFAGSDKFYYYNYRNGMTFSDFFVSDYFDEETDGSTFHYGNVNNCFSSGRLYFDDEYLEHSCEQKIRSADEGCFKLYPPI